MRKGASTRPGRAGAGAVRRPRSAACPDCWTGTPWQSRPGGGRRGATRPWDQYCPAAPCTDPTRRRRSGRRGGCRRSPRRSATAPRRPTAMWSRGLCGRSSSTPVTARAPRCGCRGITRAGHGHHRWRRRRVRPGDHLRPRVGARCPTGSTARRTSRSALNRLRIKSDHHRVRRADHTSPTRRRGLHPRPACRTPETNTTRCMPAFYSPAGDTRRWTGSTSTWSTASTSTTIPVDATSAHRTDHLLRLPRHPGVALHRRRDHQGQDHRTWSDWRGYGRVQVGTATRPGGTADRDRVPLPARHGRRPCAQSPAACGTSGSPTPGAAPSRTTKR